MSKVKCQKSNVKKSCLLCGPIFLHMTSWSAENGTNICIDVMIWWLWYWSSFNNLVSQKTWMCPSSTCPTWIPHWARVGRVGPSKWTFNKPSEPWRSWTLHCGYLSQTLQELWIRERWYTILDQLTSLRRGLGHKILKVETTFTFALESLGHKLSNEQ